MTWVFWASLFLTKWKVSLEFADCYKWVNWTRWKKNNINEDKCHLLRGLGVGGMVGMVANWRMYFPSKGRAVAGLETWIFMWNILNFKCRLKHVLHRTNKTVWAKSAFGSVCNVWPVVSNEPWRFCDFWSAVVRSKDGSLFRKGCLYMAMPSVKCRFKKFF